MANTMLYRLTVTSQEHKPLPLLQTIKEPQQNLEWIQGEPEVWATQDSQLDDSLQTLVQNPKTELYTDSLPWTPECDKSKNPTNRHIAYDRAKKHCRENVKALL